MNMFVEWLRRGGVWALLVALLLASAGACSRSQESGGDSENGSANAEASDAGSDSAGEDNGGEDNGDEQEAVPIEVVELERGRIETVLRFSTNLEAENEVTVVSQASRQLPVVQLLVEEGDEVQSGQVLLRLQNAELKTALERTRGQLAKAEREYARQTNLHEQQLISEQAYTEATYELEQLQLALRDAQRELGYTEIRAPISGTITERHVSVGNQVTPNQPLFGIVDFDSIVARVYVPEKELWRIRPGLEARVFAEAARGAERYGSVDRIAPRVDARSGTVKTTVAIPRSEELLPGMYVSVELVTAVNEDAVLVPKKALIYDADQIFIFRVVDSDQPASEGDEKATPAIRVERMLVVPKLEDRDNIEAGDLVAEGDRIVVAGQAGLKDGSLVRIVGAAASPAQEESEEPAS